MAEYDKSLDDIIKQRKIGKGAVQKSVGQNVGVKTLPKNAKAKIVVSGRVAKPQHFDARSKIGAKGQQQQPGWHNKSLASGGTGRVADARDQLATRQRVKDARDKLNQIARRSDARDKLNKIAQRSDARQKLNRLAGHHHVPQLMNQKINVHPLSLPAPTPNQLTRTVANQNRYMEPPRPTSLMARPISGLMARPTSLMSRQLPMPLHGNQKHVLMTKSGIQIIQKQPQLPPRAPPLPPSSLFSRTFSSLTKQDRPSSDIPRTSTGFPALKRKYEEDFNTPQPQRAAFDSQVAKKFLSHVSATSANRTAATFADHLQSNMNARLQSRLGPGSDSVSPLQGYKVLVANLRSIVTQHDILELFGDIGPLRRAQLLRQGIAEVVYVKLADAQKAVDSYHNRELDGQPMTCKLVNAGLTGPADHQLIGYSSSRVGTMHSDRMMSGSLSAKSRVVPDAGVIHRALFHGATNIGAAPRASITVTM